MHKYLIMNPAFAIRYTSESILGTITAKSRPAAKAKAIELTNIPNPIVVIYSSLTDKERELAESAPMLWTQPDSNPTTPSNPRGAGAKRKYADSVKISLEIGLSSEAAQWYRSQPNKAAMLRKWLESQIINR